MMTKFRKLIKVIFWIFSITVFAYFFLGELVLPANNGLDDARYRELSDGWYQNHGGETYSLPHQFDTPRKEAVSLSLRLPDTVEDDDYFCIRSSKQEMTISIDGTVRKTYSTIGDGPIGKTSVVSFVFVDLQEEDAGKELTVQTVTDTAYSGLFKSAYIGNWLGLLEMFIRQSWLEFSVSLLTIIMGIICIVGGLLLKHHWNKPNDLEYLGIGAVFAGIWLITNISFRQGIFPNISVLNDIPYYMLMLMPLAFSLYFNGIQQNRYGKFYAVLCVLLLGNFFVCTLLHITEIIDFADSIYLMAVFGVITVLSMVGTVILDAKKGFVKEYSSVVYGLLFALFTALIQLFVYFNRTIQFNGIILALGLLILLIVSSITSVKNIIRIDRDKTKAIIASKSKARFLANMSHEIRTPINAVLGMNSIILRESKEPETLEYAQDIRNAGQSLLSLINDILDFSKIESGKLELTPVEYDLNSLVHDVVNMVTEKVKEKGLGLNIYVEPSLASILFGDEIRIKQILVNLLNNAVKYTDTGSVSLRIEKKISSDQSAIMEKNVDDNSAISTAQDNNYETLLISVEDTGIGIKEEDMPNLYTAFERLDKEKNREIEGTGLGMSITVQLLDLMGSSLNVASEYGKGSKFSFALKQKIIENTPVGNLGERLLIHEDSQVYHALFEAPDAQILVVDDNAVNRKVFRSLLKKTKVRIDDVASGEECLEYIAKKHYDIIFLDHMMITMDGVETLQHMKADPNHLCQDTPVVVLTANAIRGAREEYLSIGFDDYLSKPIISEQLEEMIYKHLPDQLIKKPSTEEPFSTSPVSNEDNTSASEREEILLPELSGVNWENVLIHMADKKMLLDTIETFYFGMRAERNELAGLFEHISKAPEDNEVIKHYRTKVHAMKSEAALIGIYTLSGVAFVLEKAAINEKTDVILTLTPAFLEEWDSYEKELSDFFQGSDSAEDKPLLTDRNLLISSMEKIRDALEDLDADEADNLMASLEEYRYEEDLQELIQNLRAAVHGLDADLVDELLKQL